MMTREDYESMASIVEGEMFDGDEPVGHQRETWNMALIVAARQIRRAGLNARWADVQPVPRAEPQTRCCDTDVPHGHESGGPRYDPLAGADDHLVKTMTAPPHASGREGE